MARGPRGGHFQGEGTGMPRPSLGIVVRRLAVIGWLGSIAVPIPNVIAAEELRRDEPASSNPFSFRKRTETSSKAADAADDNFPYHGLTIVQPGASGNSLKKQALAELPLHALTPAAREKTQGVLKGLSLYRRLPTITFEVDRDVYAYFLQNPHVAVASWRAMGISKFTLEQTGPGVFTADAGDGSKGTVEVLYSTPEDSMIYCDGAFKSPLLTKPIIARSVMRLQAKFERNADGKLMATHHGDVYVELPSQTVETVAKVISPISNSIADKNFKQLTFFAHMITVAMARQPGWIEAVAQRMDTIPAADREEFLRLAAESYIAAKQRDATRNGQPLSLEDILGPLKLATPAEPRTK